MSTIYLDSQPKPSTLNRVKATLLPSGNWFQEAFPIIQWLPKYNRQWLYGDLVCALTIGIIVIPQSMAYAKMAGLPPQYGLYSSVIGVFVYPWIGTSKDISIGTTAINSLLIGQIMAILTSTPEFQSGTWTIAHITSNLTLVSGLICLVVGVLRLGILFDFICQPAIAGFMAGSGLTIVINQLNKIFGIPNINTTEPTYLIFGKTLKGLPHTGWDAMLGLTAVIFLYGVKYITRKLTHRYPKYSKPLFFLNISRNIIVVVFGTLLSFLINHFGNFSASPFKILGVVPAGFQNMGVPNLDSSLLSRILPNMVGVVVLQIMEHCSIATSLGKITDYKIQVNQEITSIGISNVLGSFFSAYPMTGAFSRTAVMSKSGCRTPLTNLLVGTIVVITIYFFTPALQYIPDAAIGAVVCHAVTDLITGPRVWVKFWNTHPSELLIFASAYIISLVTTIDISVYVPVVISIIVQLYRVARPKYAFLGRVDLMPPMEEKQQALPTPFNYQETKDNLGPVAATTTLTKAANVDDIELTHGKSCSALSMQQAMFFSLNDPLLHGRVRPIAPGIVCFQPRENLVFENVNYLYGKLMDQIKLQTKRGKPLADTVGGRPWNDPCGNISKTREKPILSSVILDLTGVHVMDYTAMEALAELTRMVDQYTGQPIPWYIVVGSSDMVRHCLLYAGFGRQQRKKVVNNIFTFHNDIKKKKKKKNKTDNDVSTDKVSARNRHFNNLTSTPISEKPLPCENESCQRQFAKKTDIEKKDHVSTMTIEDINEHHREQLSNKSPASHLAVTASDARLPMPFLPGHHQSNLSSSTVSSDQFDPLPSWCHCQEDDDDDGDDDNDDDDGDDVYGNGSDLRNFGTAQDLGGDIRMIRDRYPYFFLTLHDAANAALEHLNQWLREHHSLAANKNDAVSIQIEEQT